MANTAYQSAYTGAQIDAAVGAVAGKQDALTFDGTYDASTNKAATVSTVDNAINALDGGTIGTGGAGKTITSLSQTNGNVSATFDDISITKSQVRDFPTSMTPSAHNQASETINAMTGYTKGSSSAAVAATDTLNGAISKLENQIDTKTIRVSSLKEMRPSGSSLAGWYRVLQVTNAGTYAKSILFSIDEQFNNGAPTPSTFIINLASKGATIQQLGAAVTGPNHIKNIRVVGGTGTATTYYIDLYYGYTDTSKWNRQGFSAMNLGHDSPYDTLTLIDWTLQAASDSLPTGEVLYASAPVSTEKLYVDGNAIITGTLTLGGNPVAVVYSGSSAPSSSTGANGDIYIQTS